MPRFNANTKRKPCNCRGRCECFKNFNAEIEAMDAMVDAFAMEMKAKLRKKYIEGWSGWDKLEFESSIDARLSEKSTNSTGQEVDIANLAAMLWNMRTM